MVNVVNVFMNSLSSGGWEGQASFKMSFPSGGAIELGQHLFKLATNGLCVVVFFTMSHIL